MHTSKFRFTLNLQSVQSQISIPITLGDTGRTWYISFSDGSLPFALGEGCLAKLEIKRPTGTFLEEFCAIENETTVRYSFSQNKNTAAVEGIHECAVILYDKEDNVIGSPRFTMIVTDRVISSDDINLSDENRIAIDGMITAEAARKLAETGRVNAEASRQTSETARATAETARATAETARAETETARATAETARVNAEKTRTETETARATAEKARADAETARQEAEKNRVNAEALRQDAESVREQNAVLFRKMMEENRFLPSASTADEGKLLGISGGKYALIVPSTGGALIDANPDGDATAVLTKLRIGETVYSLPEGGGVFENVWRDFREGNMFE